MSLTYWSQDVFSKGEISPLMYGRITVNAYYNGVKIGKNTISIPQGGLTKRFGTEYFTRILGANNASEIFVEPFQYLDECLYNVVVTPGKIEIYIEDFLVKTLYQTGIEAEDIPSIDYTTLESFFRICTDRLHPKDIKRLKQSTLTIYGFTTGTNLMPCDSDVLQDDDVFPFTFDPGYGTFPAASVTLAEGTIFWLRYTGPTSQIFATEANARADTTPITFATDVKARVGTITHQHLLVSNTSSKMTARSGFRSGTIIAATFSADTTMPVTTPQIRAGKTYFIATSDNSSTAGPPSYTETSFEIYENAIDASTGLNAFVITSFGTDAHVTVSDQWKIENTIFENFPTYNFDGGYENFNFTLGARTGSGVDLIIKDSTTANVNFFTDKFVGGAYIADGGVARIVSITNPYTAKIDIEKAFSGTGAITPIAGKISVLNEPAWSDARGWPKKCSSFQNRGIFANTSILSNGIWLSTTNDFSDFNDLQTNDDSAISWYPSSDSDNSIKFLVPYRSLTVHTTTGIYSTPISNTTAITPINFSLVLQDSTAATRVQPKPIDNQIIIISGNDVHSMVWDGLNNSYTSKIVSITSEHLINDPVDEATYADLNRAGSRYSFIVNSDGSIAIFQTLISEDIAGFTPVVMEQTLGNAYFRKVLTTQNGRCWFVVEREICTPSNLNAGTPVAISAIDNQTMTATGVSFDTTNPTPCQFTTASALPTAEPQIELSTTYWAVGIDANTFTLYKDETDADNGSNPFTFTSAGTSSNVVPYSFGTTITAVSGTENDILTATGVDISTTTPTMCEFTTTGTLPVSTPQIEVETYYWCIGEDANTFKVYLTKNDADSLVNAIVFVEPISFTGTNQIIKYPLTSQFYLEELRFDRYVDCAISYNGDPIAAIGGLSRFRGQTLQMNGDGYGFEDNVYGNVFEIAAHGIAVEVSEAQIGFGINVEIRPLPFATAMGTSIKQTNLASPRHIRTASFMFNNTIGGTINGKPIVINKFNQTAIDSPPLAQQGFFEMGIMKGWNSTDDDAIIIQHSAPFDIKLLGIFYKAEV